jgi:hypothetical protein
MYRLTFTMCLVVLLTRMATAQAHTVNQEASRRAGVLDNRQFPITVIRSQCIDFTDVKKGTEDGDFRDCKVSEFGQFGTVEGESYFYAVYCLIPGDEKNKGQCGDDSFVARYHRHRGLAIFAADPSLENTRLLFERVSSDIGIYFYEKPQIVQTAAGTLLYIPIALDGTGNGNESEYYIRGSGQWEPIDTQYWLDELPQRLPAGLQIWKGIWPDVKTLQAEAGLYREGDANCCPTGGIARIQLTIRDRRFLIDSVVIEQAK